MTTASSDQVGQHVPCVCCSSPVVVADATEATIKAGEDFAIGTDAILPEQIELGETSATHDEISNLASQKVKQQIQQQSLENCNFDALGCSRWKRLFGMLIDGFAGGASVVVGFLLAVLLANIGGDDEKTPMVFLVMITVPAMFLICQWYMIAVDGRTVGKYCVKSKIVNYQGLPPGFFQGIVLRIIVVGFLGLIPLFGAFNACWIFNQPKRCLHDLIAGTWVIDA